jgi:hypothetical protein
LQNYLISIDIKFVDRHKKEQYGAAKEIDGKAESVLARFL